MNIKTSKKSGQNVRSFYFICLKIQENYNNRKTKLLIYNFRNTKIVDFGKKKQFKRIFIIGIIFAYSAKKITNCVNEEK